MVLQLRFGDALPIDADGCFSCLLRFDKHLGREVVTVMHHIEFRECRSFGDSGAARAGESSKG